MSEWRVEVVRVRNVQKHPNADTLSTAEVYGYPAIFKTGDFAEGDLAVYVPVESIVDPARDSYWEFLKGHNRIRAKRLRGVFSMGLLRPLPDPGMAEGEDVAEKLGISRWEPPAVHDNIMRKTPDAPEEPWFPRYTDIEALRRWPDVLREGEDVVVTEKIHGANARFAVKDGKLYVGSHKRIKEVDVRCIWWRMAVKYGMTSEEFLAKAAGLAIYGEVYGKVQDLGYGVPAEESVRLAVFDVFDLANGRYLDWQDVVNVTEVLGLPLVPVLYQGPWGSGECNKLAEGETTLGAGHVREGFVVRPVRERFERHVGRVILKMHGEGYLTRKE